MPDRYVEILHSYWWRCRESIGSVVATCLVLLAIFFLLLPKRNFEIDVLVMLYVAIFGGKFLWNHLREQMTNYHRRLAPKFTGASLTVFSVLSILVVLLGPIALERSATTIEQMTAITAISFAVVGCLTLMASGPLYTIIGLGCCVALESHEWWFASNGAGVHFSPAFAFCLILIAAALSIAVMVWMSFLTEEQCLYHRPSRRVAPERNPKSSDEMNQNWTEAARGAIFQLPKFQRSFRDRGSHSLFARTQRWRYLMSSNSVFGSLLIPIFVIAADWFLGPHHVGMGLLIVFSFFLPALSVGFGWLRHWRYFDTQLLKPIARPEFIRELGTARAIDMLIYWLAISGGAVIDAWIFSPAQLPKLSFELFASLLVQVFAYGMTVWLLRQREQGAMYLEFIILAPLTLLILWAMNSSSQILQISALVFSLFLAWLGILITRDAYRRWLEQINSPSSAPTFCPVVYGG